MKWTPFSRALGHHVLGGLAGEERVEAERDRARRSRPRRPARHDPDAVHRLGPGVPHERLLPERRGAALAQLGERDALGRAPDEADAAALVLGERLGPLEPERRADQGVVAHLGVRVERQVVAGERDVGVEQRLAAAPSSPGRSRAGGSPRTARGGRARAGRPAAAARSNSSRWAPTPGDHARHLLRARHLQAVGPVVGERVDLEQLVEVGDDLVARGHAGGISPR